METTDNIRLKRLKWWCEFSGWSRWERDSRLHGSSILRTKSFHCFYCFYSVFAYYRWWERQPNNIVLNWISVVASTWRGSRIRNVDFWWQMMRWNFSPSHVCSSEVPLFRNFNLLNFCAMPIGDIRSVHKISIRELSDKEFRYCATENWRRRRRQRCRKTQIFSFFFCFFYYVAYDVWFGWDKLKVIRWHREWMSSRHDMILITLPE